MSAPNAAPMALAAEVVDVDHNTNLVHALKKLQLDRIRTEVELAKEMFQVELKYQDKLKEFLEKRRQIVNGEYTPTEQECKYEYAAEGEEVVISAEKGIKHFWVTIFRNLDLLNEMVNDDDFTALEHLTDVRAVLLDNPKRYQLEFEFSENKFFSNKLLTKTYFFSEDIDTEDPLNYENLWVFKAEGCTIDWKSSEVNLTVMRKSKKIKNRKSNEIKIALREEKRDSFFNFFDPPKGSMHELEEEDRELLMADIDIGETLRLNVIPRAVIYFTGEGIDDDDYDEMDEDDYLDEDDELDDEDDEDDDDDAPDGEERDAAQPPQRARRANARAAAAARAAGARANNQGGQDVTPPECKQQ